MYFVSYMDRVFPKDLESLNLGPVIPTPTPAPILEYSSSLPTSNCNLILYLPVWTWIVEKSSHESSYVKTMALIVASFIRGTIQGKRRDHGLMIVWHNHSWFQSACSMSAFGWLLCQVFNFLGNLTVFHCVPFKFGALNSYFHFLVNRTSTVLLGLTKVST